MNRDFALSSLERNLLDLVDLPVHVMYRCGRCGTSPAAGDASIRGTRYCHAGPTPTCYQLAAWASVDAYSDPAWWAAIGLGAAP